jgi:hypothetical protein
VGVDFEMREAPIKNSDVVYFVHLRWIKLFGHNTNKFPFLCIQIQQEFLTIFVQWAPLKIWGNFRTPYQEKSISMHKVKFIDIDCIKRERIMLKGSFKKI